MSWHKVRRSPSAPSPRYEPSQKILHLFYLIQVEKWQVSISSPGKERLQYIETRICVLGFNLYVQTLAIPVIAAYVCSAIYGETLSKIPG